LWLPTPHFKLKISRLHDLHSPPMLPPVYILLASIFAVWFWITN